MQEGGPHSLWLWEGGAVGMGREGTTLRRARGLVLFLQGSWGKQGGAQKAES